MKLINKVVEWGEMRNTVLVGKLEEKTLERPRYRWDSGGGFTPVADLSASATTRQIANFGPNILHI